MMKPRADRPSLLKLDQRPPETAGRAQPAQRADCLPCAKRKRGLGRNRTFPAKARLWSWTVQRFRPKSPPYAGPVAFEPYAVGYVDLGEDHRRSAADRCSDRRLSHRHADGACRRAASRCRTATPRTDLRVRSDRRPQRDRRLHHRRRHPPVRAHARTDRACSRARSRCARRSPPPGWNGATSSSPMAARTPRARPTRWSPNSA